MPYRSFHKFVVVPALMALRATTASGRKRGENPYYSGPRSDHFDGRLFFVPGADAGDDKTLADLLRWTLRRKGEPWPRAFPSPFHDCPPARAQGLRVALIGHASFLVQTSGVNILIDPVYSERASPVGFAGPRRVNPPGIAFDDLPPIDAVLITHNHYDHLDTRTLARVWRRDRPRILAPLGNDTIIKGFDADIRVDVRDWGESIDLGNGVVAHLEPALHWSARWTNDRRMALWGAYVLAGPAGTIYHAGDTGYGEGRLFRAARERHGPPRLALLPIGAYEPRWFMRARHMNPDEAVRAMLDLGAEQALGYHWGTFRLTDEGIEQPPQALAQALAERALPAARFAALRPGESWEG